MKTIAQRLVQLREAAGLSQQDLATRSGVSIQTISRYERGIAEPRRKTLTRLASALGVDIDLNAIDSEPLAPNEIKERLLTARRAIDAALLLLKRNGA